MQSSGDVSRTERRRERGVSFNIIYSYLANSNVNEQTAEKTNWLTLMVGNALKFQIEGLQASNLELQAFRDVALRASKNSLALPSASPSAAQVSDFSGLNWHGSVSSEHDSGRQLVWDGRRAAPFTAFHPYSPSLEEELLTINSKSNLPSTDTNRNIDIRCRHHEADDVGQGVPHPNSNSRSASCDTADTLRQSMYPETTVATSGKQDAAGEFAVSHLHSEIGFDSLQAFPTPSPDQTMPRQSLRGGGVESAMARRPSSASTGSCRREKRQGAMKIAVANRQASIVRLLIKHGADVNARDEIGRTVLHDAAEANDGEMVQLLLDNRVDPDAVDRSGMTSLEVAASLGNVEVAEVLLRTSSDGDNIN